MDNFSVLYHFELKKLMQKKILWITLILCLAAIVFSILFPLAGTYYVNQVPIDSNYNQHIIDKNYRKALSGRAIDQALLRETMEGYSHVPMDAVNYSQTEEYQFYARPYSEIFRIIRQWTGMDVVSTMQWAPDEEALYSAAEEGRKVYQNNYYLTEAELAHWQAEEAKLQTPLTYQYHDGYAIIMEVFLTVGVMMLLYTAICISGIFPEEHTRRTDQLILCTTHGRTTVYTAKLAAGITAGTAGALMMTITAAVLSLVVYGAEGFDTAIQIYIDTYAAPITIGQGCIIAYGALLVTAVFMSVFVMFLSELLSSSIAALSVTTGLILAGALVNIPTEYRILSQLWDSLPTTYLAVWNVFDCRLISIMGQHFPSYVIVPAIYILCAVLLGMFGKFVYNRYQVSGR